MAGTISKLVIFAAAVLAGLSECCAAPVPWQIQSQDELDPREIATISQCVEQSMAAIGSSDVWIREEIGFDTSEVVNGIPTGVLLREVRTWRVFMDTARSRYAWFMTMETSGQDWEHPDSVGTAVPLNSFSWHAFWWEGQDRPMMRAFGSQIMEQSRPPGTSDDLSVLSQTGFPDPRGIPFRGRPGVRRLADRDSATTRSARPELPSGVIRAQRFSDRVRIERGQKEQQFAGVNLTGVTDYDLVSLMPISSKVILRGDGDDAKETVFQSFRVDWQKQQEFWLPTFSSHERKSSIQVGDREEYGKIVSGYEVRWNKVNGDCFPDDVFERVQNLSLDLVNEYVRDPDNRPEPGKQQPR